MPSNLPPELHPEIADIVISRAGEIHFICAWKRNSVHFKVHLSEFMPQDIYLKYIKTEMKKQQSNEPGSVNNIIDIDKDCQECDKYKNKIKELQDKIEDLYRIENRLKISKKAVEQREEKLNDIKDDLKQQLEDANAELSNLRRENIDITKYMEWSAEEFVDYICTIEDGRFIKYEEILRETFKNEDIDGQAIPHIEKNEWRNFGVKNYMDRTILHKCIKNLTQQTGTQPL